MRTAKASEQGNRQRAQETQSSGGESQEGKTQRPISHLEEEASCCLRVGRGRAWASDRPSFAIRALTRALFTAPNSYYFFLMARRRARGAIDLCFGDIIATFPQRVLP